MLPAPAKDPRIVALMSLHPGRCQVKGVSAWQGERSFQLQSWDLETGALKSLPGTPAGVRSGRG